MPPIRGSPGRTRNPPLINPEELSIPIAATDGGGRVTELDELRGPKSLQQCLQVLPFL
jgi:hypothetical protein